MAQCINAGSAREVGAAWPGPGNVCEGTGGGHHSDPPTRGVNIRRRPGMVQIWPAASMRQVDLIKMPEGGQEPALGKVIGMIIGREHSVKAHPFQLVEIFGI